MNQIFSTLIFAGIIPWSAQAVEVKQPVQYNPEATQKLQEKINSIKFPEEYAKIGSVEFLKSVDELLSQGADPNVTREIDKNDTLVALLFGVPFVYIYSYDQMHPTTSTLNFSVLEKTIKYSLERGARLDIQGDKGAKNLHLAVTMGTPTMVKLIVDHGVDITQKNNEGSTVLTALERDIQETKDELSTMSESDRFSVQKNLTRMEQIRDILRTAEQKK